MKCPCKACLVYVRCKQKVKKNVFFRTKNVSYSFNVLLDECEMLRQYFEVNTLIGKVNIRFLHDQNIFEYIKKQPLGKKHIEEFLKIMGHDKMPNTLNPEIRLKRRRRKK